MGEALVAAAPQHPDPLLPPSIPALHVPAPTKSCLPACLHYVVWLTLLASKGKGAGGHV